MCINIETDMGHWNSSLVRINSNKDAEDGKSNRNLAGF